MPNESATTPARKTARRKARSLVDQPLIIGSLVTSARKCGNKGCTCAQGHKHVNTYLAVSIKGKRTMICIPKHLVTAVRRCVENHKNLQKALVLISSDCLDAFLHEKKGRPLF
jgi:hypothetical protein